ncbi:MAG: membrane protein insertion efficiency factor YidD [Bacilli bacterium]|nr:membrane protein insertion efficiency factor YidD [Bacilli bacterium]
MIKNILIGIINIYQKVPGPWHGYCKHVPTCSQYAKEAITEYGCFKGCALGIKRILKCNPLGTFGYDPVPKKESKNEK